MAIINEPKSLVRRIGLAARLFQAKMQVALLKGRIEDLDRTNEGLRIQRDLFKMLYESRQHDRDVLQGIGVERQEDGSWRFNFDSILCNMAAVDHGDVAAALKRRNGFLAH